MLLKGPKISEAKMNPLRLPFSPLFLFLSHFFPPHTSHDPIRNCCPGSTCTLKAVFLCLSRNMHFCAIPLSACSKFKHDFGGPYLLCFIYPPFSLYLFHCIYSLSHHSLFFVFIPSSFYKFTQAPDVCVASVHLALQHRVCGIVRGPRIYARTQTHSHARVRVGSVCLATQYVCTSSLPIS